MICLKSIFRSNQSTRSAARSARAGLTLVELLVVLVILAILTTVAITATDTMIDQARYDATAKTLQNISEAITGPQDQRNADGTILVTGFVADTGRLPVTLAELMTRNEASLKAFSLYALPTGTVPMTPILAPAGWNGPYIRLQTTATTFQDGWGNPIIYDAGLGTLTSLGADNKADTGGGDLSGYNKDLVWTLPSVAGMVQGQITIQTDTSTPARNPSATDGTITVYYIAPNAGSDSGTVPVKQVGCTIPVANASIIDVTTGNIISSTPTSPPGSGPTSYVLTKVAQGPRVVWAAIDSRNSPYTRIMVRPTVSTVNLLAQ